jgi:hypothetical protein
MVDANNLVSYPKSGTSTYSLTGSNVATLFNGVGYNSLNGGSWTFDGVDDYISLTVTGLPTGASARTVNIWVKITGTTGNPYYALCGYGSPNISQTFDLGFNDTTDKVFLDIYGAGGITSANSITKDEWHMITGIYTGAQLQLYIDGVLEATNNYVINTANSAFEISDTAWGYPAPLVGNVANAQIYNRALSSTEVQQNYQATKDKFLGQNIVTSGLVLNLDSANKDSYPGTGTTWTDLSGNGNNGTLVNGLTFLPNSNGGIFNFDNADDAVICTNNASVQITVGTITGWFKVTNGSSVNGIIAKQNAWGLFVWNDTLSTYDWGNTAQRDTGINVADGNWHYAVMTFTETIGTPSNNAIIYLDGTAVLTTTVKNLNQNVTVQVGEANASQYFGGFIGQASIYNRVLSSTEVLQNYNAQKTRFGL